ncbi:unnamed protein product [Parascedosporium putredinis]|uniref:tRNA(Ile)-lysidine synthetase n=1 Tax=Parascedosporium putredinis TaxID=1442378 RepID=A0A9P1HDJ7_9PEZI|nr:unnamed protein product [Parascedosporium putredinis]CAI8004111.1 unnamed protein product [Parascedosporium putredinis]
MLTSSVLLVRAIGLAISGGVDSMAMAFLFPPSVPRYPASRSATACGGIDALIVDHKLRDGSTDEALGVSGELSKLPHIRPQILTLDWAAVLGSPDVDPRTIANLETAARQGAHHMDDQYETILMRLLAGHSRRGLTGMHPSKDIPECHGVWKVHQSGFVDMMKSKNPHLTYAMRRREVSALRKSLLSELLPELKPGSSGSLQHLDLKSEQQTFLSELHMPEVADLGFVEGGARSGDLELPQLETEDGGVRVLRPLLEFPKDRLIATCEHNGVRWYEDHTNKDPGLTPRNAVRHLARNYVLPEALQRPAILQMAARIKDSLREEEKDLEVAGEQDLAEKRMLATLLLRKLMIPVDANPDLPALATLQGPVSRLYPHLATDAYPASSTPSKAFNCGDVHFSPLPDNSADDAPTSRWLLSRTPYTSSVPLPSVEWTRKGFIRSTRDDVLVRYRSDRPLNNKHWRLFDGRFWVRVHLRIPGVYVVKPWRSEDADAFPRAHGDAPPPPLGRKLKALLAEHAPGKVRWTLPALYYRGALDWATLDARPDQGWTLLALPSLGCTTRGSLRWLSTRYGIKRWMRTFWTSVIYPMFEDDKGERL